MTGGLVSPKRAPSKWSIFSLHGGAHHDVVCHPLQVCALLWSKHHKELVSSHGFSENQLCLWKYPTMAKIKEFKGHKARVLHLEQVNAGWQTVGWFRRWAALTYLYSTCVLPCLVTRWLHCGVSGRR